MFDVRMGNVDDPKDADLIKAASPLFKADKIVRPLLIGHAKRLAHFGRQLGQPRVAQTRPVRIQNRAQLRPNLKQPELPAILR